jgi:conjugal transfer pilus assembly protein TraV
MNKLTFVLSISVLLQGCASVGNSEFSCSGIPDGTRCSKTSDLYNEVDKKGFEGTDVAKNTNKTTYSNRRRSRNTIGRNFTGDVHSRSDNRSGKKGERFFGEVPQVSGGDSNNLLIINPPVADGTSPQRMLPKMRRFWISPWVDKDDAYHGEQLLFVDIEFEHWKNGSQTQGVNPIFNPLK